MGNHRGNVDLVVDRADAIFEEQEGGTARGEKEREIFSLINSSLIDYFIIIVKSKSIAITSQDQKKVVGGRSLIKRRLRGIDNRVTNHFYGDPSCKVNREFELTGTR